MKLAQKQPSRRTVRRTATALCLGLVVAAVAAVSLAQGAPPFDRVAPAAVDQAQKAFAQKVAHDTLTAWKAGRYTPLDVRYTDQMKTALPPAKQQQSYEVIKATFGDYQSLAFHEAYRSKSGPSLTVYRFRGSFAQTATTPEVRVVLDGQGKVAGFFILAWFDQLR